MRLDIRYRTEFIYDDLVRESQNELRACPTSDEFQQLIAYRVMTSPSARVQSYTDYWGTRVDAFGFRQPHLALDFVAEASVETHPRPLVTIASRLDDLRQPQFVDEHIEFLGRSSHARWGPGVEKAAEHTLQMADDVVGLILAVHRLVGTTMRYVPGSTYIGVDVEDVLASGQGVCQDFAHMAVAICRAAGVPARYVSGYLFTIDDSTGEIQDQTAVEVQTHAWFEAAVPRVRVVGARSDQPAAGRRPARQDRSRTRLQRRHAAARGVRRAGSADRRRRGRDATAASGGLRARTGRTPAAGGRPDGAPERAGRTG